MKQIQDRLKLVRETLQADGYELLLNGLDGGRLRVTIVAQEGACEECLVPKVVMERILLKNLGDAGVGEVEVTYPGD